MKQSKITISLIALGLATLLTTGSSCKKAIEIDSVGYIPTETAITKESDLFDLINSGYFALADDNYYGGAVQVYNELLGDHFDGTTLGGDYRGAYNRSATIFNTGITDLYGQMNKPVYQANLVLDNIGLATAANKNSLEGQAKFMRSLAFFDLVRLYAQPYTVAGAATEPGIPLRLNSTRQQVVRKSVAAVYQQIITDLKSAENLLPGTNDVYATKWSAKALLAKVYFQMNDFTNAYLYANDVIENGGFDFDVDYSERISQFGSDEIIFGLIYESNNTQGRFRKLRNAYNTSGSGLPDLRLTNAFYTRATSNPSDTRKAWYIVKSGFYLLGKFDSAVFVLPAIHLTEIKLIRAESAAETNTNLGVAIGDMNDIIERAYGPASPLLLPANANAALVKEAARRERELEMVGEGNRVQELKRRAAKGEVLTIRGATYNCPGMIFPFPTNEVNYSSPGFVQNPTGNCN